MSTTADDAWQPELFAAHDPDRLAEVERLKASGAARFVHDTLRDQLLELLSSRDPVRKWTAAELEPRLRAHLGPDGDLERYGTWVFYPWSARLVRVLPRDEFRELRTDRNRYKITADEQQRLGEAVVGVIGLSVGNMAAVTLALEGIGGILRLADFDRLSLSNLNRLRGGVHELGVEKTVLAARELYEIDPYLDVEIFREGVGAGNLDAFLLGDGRPLDLLVEECDDLYVKIAVRERARAHRIPVIMDTSDRGLLDIERFDLEPERPVLHGLIGETRAEELQGLRTKDKVPFFLAIVDAERMSTRMAASLPEIEQTISSWPQLASSVALGGAITADAARRIILGELTESGRFYVDPETIVASGTGMYGVPVDPPPPFRVAPEARRPPSLPARPATRGETSEEAVRWIAAMGTLAPSAHNAQPWRLVWRPDEGVLECRHDPARDLPSLDFEHGATYLALGALAENVSLAAGCLGLAVEVETWPERDDAHLVCRIRFRPEETGAVDPLVDAVARRVTNRRRDGADTLPEGVPDLLARACATRGGHLQLLADRAELEEIGELMGDCDRVTFLNASYHGDAMHGYLWTPEEVRRHPHGLDVATMELTPSERAGLALMQQWRTMEFLGRAGGGRALGDLSRKLVAGASAVGLVTMPGTGRESFFEGGRAVQRLWLEATMRGIALHPMTGLPYLFARLERGAGDLFSEDERETLRGLRRRYLRLFSVGPGHGEVLLFRLHCAGPPVARSLRRPLDEVLRMDGEP